MKIFRWWKRFWKWLDKKTSMSEPEALELMDETAKRYGYKKVFLIKDLRKHTKKPIPAKPNLEILSNN